MNIEKTLRTQVGQPEFRDKLKIGSKMIKQ